MKPAAWPARGEEWAQLISAFALTFSTQLVELSWCTLEVNNSNGKSSNSLFIHGVEGEEAEKERCSGTEAQRGRSKGPSAVTPQRDHDNSFGGYSRSVRELLSDIGILGKNFLVVGTGLHSANGPFLSPETAQEAPLPWLCRHPGGQSSLEENCHSVIKLSWGLHRCPSGPGDRHVCVGTPWPQPVPLYS